MSLVAILPRALEASGSIRDARGAMALLATHCRLGNFRVAMVQQQW